MELLAILLLILVGVGIYSPSKEKLEEKKANKEKAEKLLEELLFFLKKQNEKTKNNMEQPPQVQPKSKG